MAPGELNKIPRNVETAIEQCIEERWSFSKDPDLPKIIKECIIEKTDQCFETEMSELELQYPLRRGHAPETIAKKYHQILQNCLTPKIISFFNFHSGRSVENYVPKKLKIVLRKSFLNAVDQMSNHPSFDTENPNHVRTHSYGRRIYDLTVENADQYSRPFFEELISDNLLLSLILFLGFPLVYIGMETVAGETMPLVPAIIVKGGLVIGALAGTAGITGYIIYKGESEWNKIEDLKHQALWYIENCLPPRTETYLVWEQVEGKEYEGLVPHTREVPLIKHKEHAQYLPEETNCENWVNR